MAIIKINLKMIIKNTLLKTVIPATFLAFLFTAASGQEKNDTIREIEKIVLAVNLDTNFQVVILKNEAFLDSGFIKQPGIGFGTLTGIFKNNAVYKIHEYTGIKQMNDFATTDYYFSEGKLIFVSESENYGPEIMIDSAGTIDHKISEPDFEGFYYFHNDKLFKRITKGEQRILPNEKYFDSQSKEGQLLTTAQKYLELLTKKKEP
jgi:hypothetical protein